MENTDAMNPLLSSLHTYDKKAGKQRYSDKGAERGNLLIKGKTFLRPNEF